MRIIAGEFKGRTLAFPKTRDVRPAMDKVRGSIFNVLGEVVNNADVLDLFAGCGSLGFEALSRGAHSVTFVDTNHLALDSISTNASKLRVIEKVKIFAKPAISALPILKHTGKQFHLIFIDPPYDLGYLRKTLSQIYDFDILRPFGWIVIEHSKRELPEEMGDYKIVKQTHFGATYLTYLFRRA
ncbi:MAG: 16S rRNA (guanine(966)-N(2))-methyltransferase RsmD [Candidatus Omnitrophica bacterium]|nr:16S rRNA (guanine(966)-N(2))-methyltransferase RsmD [Candidatus Omnitrophota bacterium]